MFCILNMKSPKICMIFSGTFRCFHKELFDKFVLRDRDIDMVCSLNRFDGTYPPYLTYFHTYNLPDSWEFVGRNGNWNNYNTCSMYYHNMKAFQRAEKLKPDIVIKFRSDVIPSMEFPDIIPEPNTVYHPSCNIYSGINDQVALGDFESMRKYCDLYNHLEEYVRSKQCNFHPETLLLHHLRTVGLNIKTFNFNYSLDPKRRNN